MLDQKHVEMELINSRPLQRPGKVVFYYVQLHRRVLVFLLIDAAAATLQGLLFVS